MQRILKILITTKERLLEVSSIFYFAFIICNQFQSYDNAENNNAMLNIFI